MNKIDLDLLEELAIRESRTSFWAYYRYMNPNIKIGWWQKVICQELESFYNEFINGLRPKMVIQAPPQHGKSVLILNFICWLSGKLPDCKSIFTSFSERLGVRANLFLQRSYDSLKYQNIFPSLKISPKGNLASSTATRNREFIEYIGFEGYFRNTTVKGSVTGESLDLGIIDDPIKGSEEAASVTMRDKVFDWFTDDFFSRFSENAGFLTILTRWHIDDPVGRLLDSEIGKDIKVISYPAIATKDEKFRKEGRALFPQHKSIDFLLERKKTLSASSWAAIYQQEPQIIGGEVIKGKYFGFYDKLPLIKYRAIYADTAQKSTEVNDYSVFECWGLGEDGKLYLIDMIRGKWESPELKRRAVTFWNKHAALEPFYHGQLRELKVEDKSSGTGLIQELKLTARIPIAAIQRTKDKWTRVDDILGYIESGYVMLPINGEFVNDFIRECEAFTKNDSHQHDDQIDPMVDAINDMLAVNNVISVWENFI